MLVIYIYNANTENIPLREKEIGMKGLFLLARRNIGIRLALLLL